MAVEEGLPWKRVEPAVNRFVSCCQLDFDRLSQHQRNLEKLAEADDGAQKEQQQQKLRREQDSVVRTLHQLKTNLSEMEKLYHQTRKSDWPRLAAGVQPVRQRFDQSLADLSTEPQLRASLARRGLVSAEAPAAAATVATAAGGGGGGSSTASLALADATFEAETAIQDAGRTSSERSALISRHAPTEEKQLAIDAENALTCERISENLEDVRDMMATLAAMVKTQEEHIDHIEQNIDSVAANVSAGSRHLAQAAKWKAAVFPVIGALVGGVVGGPVGLVAGLKIGGLAALGGATVGAVAATQIKKMATRTAAADQLRADTAVTAIALTKVRDSQAAEQHKAD